MDTLAALAQAVTESLELSEVLDRVARASTGLLPDASARIWVLEGDHLVLRGEHGPYGTPQSGLKGALAIGEGLTGRAAAAREVVIVDDVVEDPGTINRDWMREQGYVSFIGIPLCVRGRLVSVLGLFTRHRHEFTAEEVDLLTAFGTHAAIAVEHGRLYKEAKDVRDFLQAMTENSADAIITTDVQGRFTYFSPGAQDMFGYRAQEILGHRINDYYRGGIDEARAVMRGLRADGKIRHREIGFRAQNGQWVETSASISLLQDPNGATIGTLGVVRDITDRKKAEAAQREAAELRTITTLATSTAHEINNPLAVLKGRVDMLIPRLPEDSIERKWMEQAQVAAVRIQEMVGRMQKIARVRYANYMDDSGVPRILDFKKASEEHGPSTLTGA
jgi:PAS domain S-box-containing protein